MNVSTFIANLRHAIRNHEIISMGGGIFSGQELIDVAAELESSKELLSALELLLIMIDAPDDSPEIVRARAAIAKARGE